MHKQYVYPAFFVRHNVRVVLIPGAVLMSVFSHPGHGTLKHSS